MGSLLKIVGLFGLVAGCFFIYSAYGSYYAYLDGAQSIGGYERALNPGMKPMLDGYFSNALTQTGLGIVAFVLGVGFIVGGSRMSSKANAEAIAAAMRKAN